MRRGLILMSGNYPPEKGGPSKFVEEFSRWAANFYKEVLVISSHPSKRVSLSTSNIKVELFSRAQPRVSRYFQTINFLLRSYKSGWIILANGNLLELAIAALSKRMHFIVKLPGDIVWEQAIERGDTDLGMLQFQKSSLPFKYSVLRKLTLFSLNRARKIIVPSNVLAEVCRGWGVSSEKLIIIPNSVNLDLFSYNKSAVKNYDVITVSRLISIKQIDELIRACSNLKLKLLVVGDGPLKTQLEKINVELGGYAHFFGAADQLQLPELYASAKIFALNSSFESGTPYALLEARACGLPAIANEKTGSEDVIKHLEDGILCGPSSKLSLESAISLCLEKLENGHFNPASIFTSTFDTYSTSDIYSRIQKVLDGSE